MQYIDIFDGHENVETLDERDDETLFRVTIPNLGISIPVLVITPDGSRDEPEEYYVTDWQGQTPTTLDECADYDWVSGDNLDF